MKEDEYPYGRTPTNAAKGLQWPRSLWMRCIVTAILLAVVIAIMAGVFSLLLVEDKHMTSTKSVRTTMENYTAIHSRFPKVGPTPPYLAPAAATGTNDKTPYKGKRESDRVSNRKPLNVGEPLFGMKHTITVRRAFPI